MYSPGISISPERMIPEPDKSFSSPLGVGTIQLYKTRSKRSLAGVPDKAAPLIGDT
ncbi:hypothetical protein D3C85_1648800 [compost metagenome]